MAFRAISAIFVRRAVTRLCFRTVLNWLLLARGGVPPAAGREPRGVARAGGGGGLVRPPGRLPGVDVRDSGYPVLARARRWLARVNARHPWDHNEHFHGWILRNLPARRRAAVDVGCGTGVLAGKLAPHFARVTGIDADADRKSTRLNSSHTIQSRMPSSA